MILANIAKPPSVNIPIVISNCPKIYGPNKPRKRPKAFTMAIPVGVVSTVKKEGRKAKKIPAKPYNPIAAKVSDAIIINVLSEKPVKIYPTAAKRKLVMICFLLSFFLSELQANNNIAGIPTRAGIIDNQPISILLEPSESDLIIVGSQKLIPNIAETFAK